MYARMVKGQFKPDKFDFVTNTLEKDVIPLLKRQNGFRDELSFFSKEMKEGYAISFWDSKSDLEKYERDVYPKVHEKMAEAFSKHGIVTGLDDIAAIGRVVKRYGCSADMVTLQERHLTQAFQEVFFEKVFADQRNHIERETQEISCGLQENLVEGRFSSCCDLGAFYEEN